MWTTVNQLIGVFILGVFTGYAMYRRNSKRAELMDLVDRLKEKGFTISIVAERDDEGGKDVSFFQEDPYVEAAV